MGKKLTLNVDGKELTKKDLKERFDKYNAMYFDGKLGKCKFYLFPKNIYTFGKYTDIKQKDGSILSKIYIGQNFVITEENLELIIVHEMIHMYVRTVENVKFDGLLGHGFYFRKHRKRLKKNFGLKIDIHPKLGCINNKKHIPKLWERVLLWIIDR